MFLPDFILLPEHRNHARDVLPATFTVGQPGPIPANRTFETLPGATFELPQNSVTHSTELALWALAVVSTLICGSRLYVRYFVVNSFGMDDIMVIIALILCIGYSTMGVVMTRYGLGTHLWNVSPEDLAVFHKVYYASICTYIYVALAVKTSLLIFLMRVFSGKVVQLGGKIMISFLILFSVSSEFAITFQCQPARAMWDKKTPGRCWSGETLYAVIVYQGVVMTASDIIILMLPMWDLWKLNWPLRQKMQLIILLGLGMAATIVSVIRLATSVDSAKDVVDYTYSTAQSVFMMALEFHLGLMTGSLPSLRLLPGVRRLFQVGDRYDRTSYSTQITGGDGMDGRNARGGDHAVVMAHLPPVAVKEVDASITITASSHGSAYLPDAAQKDMHPGHVAGGVKRGNWTPLKD